MDVNTILLGVLLVLASALCGVGIWALTEGVKTARSTKRLTDDLDERVVPLMEKADVTIDALNAELLRVDSIISRIEDVTERVDSTTRTVQGVANAPGEIVTDIADRVRRAWKNRQAESSAASDSRQAEAASAEAAEADTEASGVSDSAKPPTWPTLVADPIEPENDTGPAADDTTPV